MVAELLDDERLGEPGWVDDQGWRYALPNAGVETDCLEALSNHSLYVAGDWLSGSGRAHEAFWCGVETASQLSDTTYSS